MTKFYCCNIDNNNENNENNENNHTVFNWITIWINLNVEVRRSFFDLAT